MRRTGFLSVLVLALAFVGCGDDSPSEPAEGGGGDAGSGTESDTGGGGGGGETDAGTGSEDDTGETDPFAGCNYPAEEALGFGNTVPAFFWDPAFDGQGEQFTFDLLEFYCDDEKWGQYETLIMLISSGWCPNCPRLIQWIDLLGPQLEEAGALVLFIEAQDNEGGPADSALAQSYFSRYAGANNSGIRVGDANNNPFMGVNNDPWLRAFPSSLIVRRSDMSVIADSARSNYILPYVEVAQDPDADWSNPPPPEITPEFPSNCGDEDEEDTDGENSTLETAPSIGAGSFSGGICTANDGDFYVIDIDGDWTFTMNFSHSEGDLDVYVIDPATGEPLQNEEGDPVGSYGTTDTETVNGTGSTLIVVVGFDGATTTYDVEVTAN